MNLFSLFGNKEGLQGFTLASTFLLVACGPQSPDFAILATSESTYQGSVANNKVDLLFVIDNSGSMLPQQQKLADSLDAFAHVFVAKDFDYHVAVVTTDMQAPAETGRFQGTPNVLTNSNTADFLATFQQSVKVGENGSSYELPFDAIIASLSDPLVSSTNSGFLREDAHLAIVIISNEDQDTLNSAGHAPKTSADVINFLSHLKPDRFDVLSRTYKRNYTVSAVVAPSLSDPECMLLGSTIDEGLRISALASLTNGSVASICKNNFASGLTQISQRIAEAITEIPLATQPNASTITVRFNGSLVNQDGSDGWSYDSVSNKIVFHGNAIPRDNTSINIDYIPNDIIR